MIIRPLICLFFPSLSKTTPSGGGLVGGDWEMFEAVETYSYGIDVRGNAVIGWSSAMSYALMINLLGRGEGRTSQAVE